MARDHVRQWRDESDQRMDKRVTTGLASLDEILDGLRIGDNVVWAVDSVGSYRDFVGPYIEAARRDRRRIVYFRFADHPSLLDNTSGVVVHKLDAYRGFESFTGSVHRAITEQGVGAFYLFDCLSDLLSAWATDQMVGSFFRVICPYLFQLDTIAYFAEIGRAHV